MINHIQVFPSISASLTGQSLISHAGLKVLTSFIDATGFARLAEDRLSLIKHEDRGVPYLQAHDLKHSDRIMVTAQGRHFVRPKVFCSSGRIGMPAKSYACISDG